MRMEGESRFLAVDVCHGGGLRVRTCFWGLEHVLGTTKTSLETSHEEGALAHPVPWIT
jgi:hypothetical protein